MSFFIHSFINSQSHKCSSSPTVSQTARAARSYQEGKCTFVLWRFFVLWRSFVLWRLLSGRGDDGNAHRCPWLPLPPGSAVSNPGGCAASDSNPSPQCVEGQNTKASRPEVTTIFKTVPDVGQKSEPRLLRVSRCSSQRQSEQDRPHSPALLAS